MAEFRATRPRLAILRAVHTEPGRIYFAFGDVWDGKLGIRVTAVVTYLMTHGLMRANRPGNQTHYYLTDAGKRVLGVATDSIEKEQSNG